MQQELIAGDTLHPPAYTLPDYPASAGWVLKFRLVPRSVGGTAFTLTAAANGDGYDLSVGASTTAAWGIDNYSWTSWVEKAGEIYSVDRGQISIRQDPRTAVAGYDGRSQAEKALADTKIAMAAWTPTTRSYRIGDREMTFATKADIVGLINHWEIEVKRERRAEALAEGRPDPAKTYVRLNRG